MREETGVPSGSFLRTVLRSVVSALVSAAGASLFVFILMHVVPGDPVRSMLGDAARSADVEALRVRLGLDRPLGEQLWSYVISVGRMDFGRSIATGRPVWEIMSETLPMTVGLVSFAVVVAAVLGVSMAYAVVMTKRRPIRTLLQMAASAGWALPSFWLGPMLILLFAVELGVFPVSGAAGAAAVVLPGLTLAIPLAAQAARLLGTNLEEAMRSDVARALRSRGAGENHILRRHALRLALAPLIPLFAAQVGSLLCGSVIVETVFSWPGIGWMMVQAISRRDYPLVQGAVLLSGILAASACLAGELLHAVVDPRGRGWSR